MIDRLTLEHLASPIVRAVRAAGEIIPKGRLYQGALERSYLKRVEAFGERPADPTGVSRTFTHF